MAVDRELAEVWRLVRELEWSGSRSGWPRCPSCGGIRPQRFTAWQRPDPDERIGHAGNCALVGTLEAWVRHAARPAARTGAAAGADDDVACSL